MTHNIVSPDSPLRAQIIVRVANPVAKPAVLPETESSDGTVEQRAEVRRKTLKSGKALYKGHNCTFDCLVYDFSSKGARLRLKDPFQVPEAFTLKLSTGEKHHCAVIWQASDNIGVEFT